MTLPVGAQTGTVLAVDPAQGSVALTDTAQINLAVTNGNNIMAYDITIEYNQNLLSLVSWSHGEYLSNLAVVYKVEEPGSFHLACTQLATAPVSGDGILLNLVFQGENLGSSAITISQAEFADGLGNLSNPSLTNGVLTVSNEPIVTPTSTFTPILTPTKSPTAYLTPVNTPTKSPTMTQTPTQTLTSSVETPIVTATEDPITELTSTTDGAVDITSEMTPVSITATQEGDANKAGTETQENHKPGLTLASDQNDGEDNQSIPAENPGKNALFWLLLIGGIILLVVLVFLAIKKNQKGKNKLVEY